MEEVHYDLDKWKDFVLCVLDEKNGNSLTDYIWKRLTKEFSIGNEDRKAHSVYINNVLECLENEHGLIRQTNARGIHMTDKGAEILHKYNGVRQWLNSLYRHKLLQRIKDYVETVAGILSIVTTMFTVANLFYEWVDKLYSVLPPFILLAICVTFRFAIKSK